MIHRRKGRKLKRTSSHRKALLSNLSISLLKNKKIRTTLARAKELKPFIDRLVSKAKSVSAENSHPELATHLRRIANSYLRDTEAVKILFNDIAPKVADRQGGYTRVLKLGRRQGDAAELAVIEFVDYNVEKIEEKTGQKAPSSRKTRIPKVFRGKKSKKEAVKEVPAQHAEA